MKKERGSIAVFVLVTLLFMSAFLIIAFASNINKSKAVKEQSNIMNEIYMPNQNIVESYTDAYTYLRSKNKKVITASSDTQNDKAILELNNTFNEEMDNYRIYGNSIQSTTPSPNSPVEVQSVGDLVTDAIDDNYGKYRIQIKLTNESGESKITNIYLDEPLRKVGEYADYIDFKEQKVIRKVTTTTFNGTEVWFKYNNIWAVNTIDSFSDITETNEILNTHYAPSTELSSTDIPNYTTYIGAGNCKYYIRDDNYASASEFETFIENQYNAGTPMIVYFPLLPNREENINIQSLVTFEDYTKIEILTNIPPSKVEVEYQGYTLE